MTVQTRVYHYVKQLTLDHPLARFRRGFYELGYNYFAMALLFPPSAQIRFLLTPEKPYSFFFPWRL